MDVLAGFLDAFVSAWEAADTPPDLSPFLPQSGEIRRLTLVELIKVDLEYRWLPAAAPNDSPNTWPNFPSWLAGGSPAT